MPSGLPQISPRSPGFLGRFLQCRLDGVSPGSMTPLGNDQRRLPVDVIKQNSSRPCAIAKRQYAGLIKDIALRAFLAHGAGSLVLGTDVSPIHEET